MGRASSSAMGPDSPVRRFLPVVIGILALVLATLASAQTPALRGTVERYTRVNDLRMLEEFRAFLGLPNVSTVQADMERNADWIVRYVEERGFSARVVTAGRSPYVIAERQVPGAARTLLVYAHFDGQPVEPANWATPPFEPTLKDGDRVLAWTGLQAGAIDEDWRIYARSAGDDKAPLIALMHAIEALDTAAVPLSVNVKLILDGEEEFGSPTVEKILAQHGDALAADLLLFCDGPMHQSGLRQLVFGVRGAMGVNLTTYGPLRPLHSGHYGNWAPHPTDTLMRLLTSMKDEQGRILIPGYLDEVVPISERERRAIAAMPVVDATLQGQLALGRVEGGGERLEETIMRPAINIVGIQAGGVREQARNIIVPTATAALDLRLVKAQSIPAVRRAFEQHVRALGFFITHGEPTDAQRREHPRVIRIEWDSGYPAYRSPIDGDAARRVADILTAYDGQSPLLTPTMGGSLPIYLFDEALDMPIVLLPVANHDNNQHGRDENLRLGNLFAAVGMYAALLADYGK